MTVLMPPQTFNSLLTFFNSLIAFILIWIKWIKANPRQQEPLPAFLPYWGMPVKERGFKKLSKKCEKYMEIVGQAVPRTIKLKSTNCGKLSGLYAVRHTTGALVIETKRKAVLEYSTWFLLALRFRKLLHSFHFLRQQTPYCRRAVVRQTRLPKPEEKLNCHQWISDRLF